MKCLSKECSGIGDTMWEDVLKKLVKCEVCGWNRETDADEKCPLCDEEPYRYGRDIR